MPKDKAITVRLSQDVYSRIKKKQRETESNAEICRRLIKDSLNTTNETEKLQNQITELQSEIEEKQNRINELQRKLEETNKRINASNEVVSFAKEEKRLRKKRDIKEDMKDHANIFKRIKWKFTGLPRIDEVEEGEIENSD